MIKYIFLLNKTKKYCSFVEYEKGTKKAICECQLKSKDLMISELIDEENIFIILRMKALFQI